MCIDVNVDVVYHSLIFIVFITCQFYNNEQLPERLLYVPSYLSLMAGTFIIKTWTLS